MATVPISGSRITLCSNVPLSNDYKHTRWFDTEVEQKAYFGRQTVIHHIPEANFQKVEGKSFIAVNKSIDQLHNVNYLFFQNTKYSSRWFYAFITKVEYIQRNTTYVYFELDVLQTWRWNMVFKPSFVVREHCKLWHTDGTPIVNTIDEGLDYGTEYETVYSGQYIPSGNHKFLVILTKETIHEDIAVPQGEVNPTIVGTSQPLSYYIVPYTDDSFGTVKIKNATGDIETISSIEDVLRELYKNEASINNIVSLYVTENIGMEIKYNNGVLDMQSPFMLVQGVNIGDSDVSVVHVLVATEFRPTRSTIWGNKYEYFQNVTESKLLMYPYTVTVIDDFKGNRMEIKHEYIQGKPFIIISRGSLGTSNKVTYSVANYNIRNHTQQEDNMLSMEHGIVNINPNDVPVITDYLSSFLQGNRNSIQNQKNSIVFGGAMGAIGGILEGATSMTPKGAVKGALNVVQGAGESVLAIQAIQAKQRDIDNKPPQLSKMGSNTAFDFGNRYNGVYIMKKQIKPEYRKKLTDFFKLYGYKLNEVKIPNFHTRQNWNYVQTESCMITGAFNNNDREKLKSIFDNGITLWHTDDIGNYSLSNGVI